MRNTLLVIALLISLPAFADTYELVIEGGRVMDPETGLDAVRNVGIAHGKVVRIAAETLTGTRVLHAQGLVVAPGFIDLHQHAQDLDSSRLKAFDGVTTALEMEIGVPDMAWFLNSKRGHAYINFGSSASHVAARTAAFGQPLPNDQIMPLAGPSTDDPATRNN